MKNYRSSGLWTQLPYLNEFKEPISKKKNRTSWFGDTAAFGSQASERRLVLGMASAFSVDTEDCFSHAHTVDIQEHHKQMLVCFNGITKRGPIIVSFRGKPERNQPFRLSSVQRGATPHATQASSPGFIETLSEDGNRLLAVQRVGLEDGIGKQKCRWELDVPTPQWKRVYGANNNRLIWHVRKKNRKRGQANVVCLDANGSIMWSKTEPLHISKIYATDKYVGFLVEPGANPFYWLYLVDADSGNALKVLDLSQFNTHSDGLAPEIVLTETYLVCASTTSDFIRCRGNISFFKISDFLSDNQDTAKSHEMTIPDQITGRIHQLKASTDGKYIAALIVDATFSTKEVSLLVWDTTTLGLSQPAVKKIIQPPLTSQRGTFTGGLWYVDEVDGRMDISYTEVHL